MNDFWNVEGNVLRIDGEITSDGWDWDSWSVKKGSNTRLREALQNMQGDVVVWVNSPGGSVIVGSEIYTMLRSYNGRVRVVIDGLAASAASVIAMAGDEVVMSPTAYMMIHRSSTWAAGNAADMAHEAEVLQEIDKGIVAAYVMKTGRSEDELLDMMTRETWMNAAKAQELGFCDRILYAEPAGDADLDADLADAIDKGRTRQHRVAAACMSREGVYQGTLKDYAACAGATNFYHVSRWDAYRKTVQASASAADAATPHHPHPDEPLPDFWAKRMNIPAATEHPHHDAKAHELRLKLLASFAAGDWIGGVDWAANT